MPYNISRKKKKSINQKTKEQLILVIILFFSLITAFILTYELRVLDYQIGFPLVIFLFIGVVSLLCYMFNFQFKIHSKIK